MTDLIINIEQAKNNAKLLNQNCITYIADENGNLDYISNFNLIGRVVHWIKCIIGDSETEKANKAILATFEAINRHNRANPTRPIWTYPLDVTGKDFDIGFDKVALRVLLDRSRFPTYDHPTLSKIREEGEASMRFALEQRQRWGINFDTDHLRDTPRPLRRTAPSPSDFTISIAQAEANARILDTPCATYVADEQGNLDYISAYNVFGLLVHWIKNLIDNSGESKTNKAVLATFAAINRHNEAHPTTPLWTYKAEFLGGERYLGLDKPALSVLLNKGRFPEGADELLIKIREEAFETFCLVTEKRGSTHQAFHHSIPGHLARNESSATL